MDPISASSALLTTSSASASAGMLLRPPGSSSDTWQQHTPSSSSSRITKQHTAHMQQGYHKPREAFAGKQILNINASAAYEHVPGLTTFELHTGVTNMLFTVLDNNYWPHLAPDFFWWWQVIGSLCFLVTAAARTTLLLLCLEVAPEHGRVPAGKQQQHHQYCVFRPKQHHHCNSNQSMQDQSREVVLEYSTACRQQLHEGVAVRGAPLT
jgi:hypothetical protein